MNFKQKFEEKKKTNTLYLLDGKSGMYFYYGFDEKDRYCIALKYEIPFPKIVSTKLLFIERREDVVPNSYWLYISLLDEQALNVFSSFAEDLFNSIVESTDGDRILNIVEERIKCWKKMFGRVYSQLSDIALQGLYGELYFLDTYLIPALGIDKAIKSWSGPLGSSKDFMIGNKWYEVKTVNKSKTTITISSIEQLSDDNTGILVVNKVEDAPEEFDKNLPDIMSLYESILAKLNDESLLQAKESFFDKLVKSKFAPDDEYRNRKFRIINTKFYKVDDNFPRLREEDIKYVSIAKLTYDLILRLLEDYEVESWN